MSRHRFTLEYDGTDFEGWQRQPEGHRSVQGVLEKALARAVGRPVRVVGAGRTDAGVHAEGQVASGDLETRLEPEALRRALNALLPRDLAVLEVERTAPDFHARRDARGKRYRYEVWNGRERSPLRERFALALQTPVDVTAMREAARALRGRHDFRSFQAAGSGVRTCVRELRQLEIGGETGGLVRFDLEASGFLRHMARNLVGTLLEVGRGRRDPGSMPALLAAGDRSQAGPTAPPQGLVLVGVDYGIPRNPGEFRARGA